MGKSGRPLIWLAPPTTMRSGKRKIFGMAVSLSFGKATVGWRF
jgi:hypothetical protein